MVGLQGAGKSTWVQQSRIAETHSVLSKDHWPNARHKEQRQQRLLGELLEKSCDVVVDNTNASPQERAPILEIARRHGAVVRAVYFDTPLSICLERNDARTPDRKVPRVGVFAALKRLVPPSLAEGFDSVEVVGRDAESLLTKPGCGGDHVVEPGPAGLSEPHRSGDRKVV